MVRNLVSRSVVASVGMLLLAGCTDDRSPVQPHAAAPFDAAPVAGDASAVDVSGASYLVVAKITPTDICVTDKISPSSTANDDARHAADTAANKPCLMGK